MNTFSEPVAGANIIFEETGRGTVSDSNGKFRLDNIKEGDYEISVSFIGYETGKKKISIRKNNEPLDLFFYLNKKNVEIERIVVTGTRSEKKYSESPIQTETISQEDIKQTALIRLDDILLEQPGLAIIDDHGQGIQMQGLDPAYTLIMIDGEPLIGRTTGTLELSRFTVSNLKQIEIVKGPSSSLYGSEALAGVINLITNSSDLPFRLDFQSIYKTNNTIDLIGNTNFKYDSFDAGISFNRFSSDGYDFTPGTISKTSPPFFAYTVSPQITYHFDDATNIKLNSRIYFEKYNNTAELKLNGNDYILDDEGKLTDWNNTLSIEHKFSKLFNSQLKLYGTRYFTDTRLTYKEDGLIYDHSKFDQYFYKAEFIGDIIPGEQNYIITGGGYVRESVVADRISSGEKIASSYYLFLQEEWIPNNIVDIVGGVRYDWHSEYASRLSPKLSALIKPVSFLRIRASLGSGFKAPTLQQLYLDFSNSQVGYSVFGSSNFKESFAQLQEDGQIQRVLIDPNTIKEIDAENSIAYNLGIEITPSEYIGASVNLFRNNVNDLIEASPVAVKSNGQSVFTYFNLNKIYTQGIESQINFVPANDFNFTISYQYLEAFDNDILELIRNGEIFKTGSNGLVRAVRESEYGGLFNRSKHSGTVKLFYNNNEIGFTASIRGIIRGEYGFGDLNSNGILDDKREYVPGYAIWNFSIAKKIGVNFTLLAGVENIFDKTNSEFIPSLPGRIIYGGIRLEFSKENNE